MLPHQVDPVPCADLGDGAALRRALTGVQAVVHLAARVHTAPKRRADALGEFRRINVQGTRFVLEQSVAQHVERFVFVSSVKAVGESTDVPWTEDVVPAPTSPYGVSKLEAEQVVRELRDRHALHAPILRLPLAYGPGVKANMRSLFDLVARGVPLPVGDVHNRRSLVFSGNVAEAIRAVLDVDAAASGTFFVSDREDLSTPDLVRRIAAGLGRRARMLAVPVRVLRVGGRMGDLIARLMDVPVTSDTVKRLTESLIVDASRLTDVTGFLPPYTVDEGLVETASWYRGVRSLSP